MAGKDKVSWIDKLRTYDTLMTLYERRGVKLKQLEKQIEHHKIMGQAYNLAVTRYGMPAVCADDWREAAALIVLRLDYGLGEDMRFTFELHQCLAYKTCREGVLFAHADMKELFIEDIQVTPNLGHGSMLLTSAIAFAKDRGLSHVTGILSRFDLDDHRDRLLHFYHKHGFSITGNKIHLGL